MEGAFILVAKAAENEQGWMPKVIQYSKIFWLVHVTEDMVVYRLRLEDVEIRRLKLAIDDIMCCERLKLVEYVDW